MKLGIKDYLVLGVSLILAFALWMVRNLSLKYSDLLQCRVTAVCVMEGHSGSAVSKNVLAVRCSMRGYSLLHYKLLNDGKASVVVQSSDMHHANGDLFYLTSEDIARYFHDIFSDDAVFEYCLTDTLYFEFPSVAYRKVPVVPAANISFRNQYMSASGLKLIPDSVYVYGDSAAIMSVKDVETRPLVMFDVESDRTGRLGLVSPGKGIGFSQDEVDYVLGVSRYVESSVILPLESVNLPESVSFRLIPSEVTVTVRDVYPSSSDLCDGLHAYVDYEDYASSRSGRCLVHVSSVPKSVISLRIEPAAVLCIRN